MLSRKLEQDRELHAEVRGWQVARVGTHMKSFREFRPVLIAGGKAGDFFGEYMAGGVLILLGMFSDNRDKPLHGYRFGTGMHGGVGFNLSG